MYSPGSASLNKALVMALQATARPYYIREALYTLTSYSILITQLVLSKTTVSGSAVATASMIDSWSKGRRH